MTLTAAVAAGGTAVVPWRGDQHPVAPLQFFEQGVEHVGQVEACRDDGVQGLTGAG
jgi:hypothetical protein